MMRRISMPLFMTTVLFVSAACSTSPTGRKRLSLLPEEQMSQMGGQAWDELKKQYKPSTDAAARDFVSRIAQRVTAVGPASNSKWEVELFDSKDINAFALPGGHIGVFTGILAVADNEAALATVLAHETGHVIAKHSSERATDELIAQGALSLASSAIGTPSLRGPLMAALGLGAQIGILLPFSRAQEAEADEMGFITMARAGYNPKEGIMFWERMRQASKGEPPAFLSDHPATADRIAHLQSLLPKAELEYARAPSQLGSGKRAPAGR